MLQNNTPHCPATSSAPRAHTAHTRASQLLFPPSPSPHMPLFLASTSLCPKVAHVPYQLHSKQTAAGSVGLPGICLGEGEEKGSREERRQKGMRRGGGEVRRTRRNCKNMTKRWGWRRGTETGGRGGCVICLGDWAAESSLVLSVLYSSSLYQVNTLNTSE